MFIGFEVKHSVKRLHLLIVSNQCELFQVSHLLKMITAVEKNPNIEEQCLSLKVSTGEVSLLIPSRITGAGPVGRWLAGR